MLTDDGREVAEQLSKEQESEGDIYDEVGKLRAEIQQMEAQLETGGEPTQDDLDQMSSRIDTLAEQVEGIGELWDGMLAIRNYLQDVHDADLHSYRPEDSVSD